VRASGLDDANVERGWVQAITGTDPGPQPQAVAPKAAEPVAQAEPPEPEPTADSAAHPATGEPGPQHLPNVADAEPADKPAPAEPVADYATVSLSGPGTPSPGPFFLGRPCRPGKRDRVVLRGGGERFTRLR
jgi:hypothetical protein